MTRVATLLLMAVAVGIWSQPGYQSQVVYERQKPVATPPTERVARLIDALSNDSLETRRAAKRALLAMGLEVRPQLQAALEAARSTLPAIDMRKGGAHYAVVELTVLLDHLDELLYSGASTITLRSNNAPLVEILRSLGSQIDARVSVSSRPDPRDLAWVPASRATLDLERVNYWDALRAIRRTSDLNPTFGAGAVEFSRGTGLANPGLPLDAPNAVVAGPILIGQLRSGTTLTLQAVAEPKVSAAYGDYATVLLDEVTDDQGQSLLSAGSSRTFTSVPRSREDLYWRWKVLVQLPPTSSGRRIGTVKGQFGVAVGPPGMDIVIADLTRGGNPVFEWDSVVVTVAPVRQSGDQYVVEGEMSAPSGSPMAKAMVDKDATGSAVENARGRFEYFGLLDATGSAIRRRVELGPIRREGDRDVIRWTLTTMDPAPLAVQLRAPGVCVSKCVPTALRWSAPETRWFMVPFELRL